MSFGERLRRFASTTGGKILLGLFAIFNVIMAVIYETAPELSAQQQCVRSTFAMHIDDDFTCAVQSTWGRSMAGMWWGVGLAAFMIIVLVAINEHPQKR